MVIFYIVLTILVLILIYKIHSFYEKKVEIIINQFREKNKKFHKIAEGIFEVKTNGLKINKWKNEHTIDYIINNNAQELILELKNFNDLKIWWLKAMPNIKEKIFNDINDIASTMFLLGPLFKIRTQKEINILLKKYNPNNIKFKLATYTYYEQGEEHYNPSINQRTSERSSSKSVTSYYELSPDELYQRIQFLSQFNFTVTQYQYNCKNQRILMTPEIRKQIMARDKYICQNCGKKCKPSEIEIDHIKPISKGGKTILSNLQVLCIKCNRQKSNKWLDDTYIINEKKYESHNLSSSINLTRLYEKINETNKNNNQIKQIIPNNNYNLSNIKWVTIESSNVNKIYYNINTKILYVKFNNFDIYAFNDVERSVFMDFLSAPSKEIFIKTELNVYDYKKVNMDEIQ